MDTAYKIGDKFEAVYTNAPVSPEAQYRIGQQVQIRVNGVPVAVYEVTETDDTTIKGIIIQVLPRGKQLFDPRRTRPL